MPALALWALLLVQILFGINYVATKVVLEQISPYAWAPLRLTIAALVLGAILISLKRSTSDERRPLGFGILFKLSLFGMILNQGAFILGLARTTAAHSSIINTSIPLFTLFIAMIRGTERPTPRKILGLALGFSGAWITIGLGMGAPASSLESATPLGDALTLVNCFCYAFFLVLGSERLTGLQGQPALRATFWLFVIGAVGLGGAFLPFADVHRFSEVVHTLELRHWACAAYGILGGTVATYALNLWAMGALGASRSTQLAYFVYLQPAVATLTAWIWLDSVPETRAYVGAALIFSGLTVNLRGR